MIGNFKSTLVTHFITVSYSVSILIATTKDPVIVSKVLGLTLSELFHNYENTCASVTLK